MTLEQISTNELAITAGAGAAIREAANYEATLYKMTFKGGQRISSKELYSPAYY